MANGESAAIPGVQVDRITKRFGDFVAVDAVSLDIQKGEFFSLLGPSGCGKTTLLRMIAGFEHPSEGILRLNGQDVTDQPPHRRPVNLVFQHFALFPHLTVARNIAFGLRYQPASKDNGTQKVEQALELVRLTGLDQRYPHELSGGQKQRVALARALVLRPQVLLLDEPLGALDQKLRKEMQVELKNLQRELGITFIFVTHDQEEAITMSDRIAVMNHGRVEQCDTSERVFEYPRTEFVAQFVGAANCFSGTVIRTMGDTVVIAAKTGIQIEMPARGVSPQIGQTARFLVRPEKLALDGPLEGRPRMESTIEQRMYQGLSTVYSLRNTAGEEFTVFEQNRRPVEGGTAIGRKVNVTWEAAHSVLLANP